MFPKSALITTPGPNSLSNRSICLTELYFSSIFAPYNVYGALNFMCADRSVAKSIEIERNQLIDMHGMQNKKYHSLLFAKSMMCVV